MRRIYGQENELGAVIKKRNGEWASVFEFGAISVPNLIMQANPFGEFQENGGRIYYDQGHLEIASPEASLVRDLVLASRGMESLVEDAALLASVRNLENPAGDRIIFFKDNTVSSDFTVTFGAHENYLVFDHLGRILSSPLKFNLLNFKEDFLGNFVVFLISRIILSGSGGFSGQAHEKGRFLLSPRAEFMDGKTGQNLTGSYKPLVSAKNESLAGLPHCFRLHVNCGDANMSEIAEFIKFGLTGLFLRLMEDGFSFSDLKPADNDSWIDDLNDISRDLTFQNSFIQLEDNQKIRPIDALRKILKEIKSRYPKDRDPEDVAKETLFLISLTEEILSKVENKSPGLGRELDWAAKLSLVVKFLNQLELSLEDLPVFLKKEPRKGKEIFNQVKLFEQRYHELSERGYYKMLIRQKVLRRLLEDGEIKKAKFLPPGFASPSARTRSWLRGKVVRWKKKRDPSIIIGWDLITHTDGLVHLTDPFSWDSRQLLELLGKGFLNFPFP